MNRKIISLIVAFFIILLPIKVGAVDFSIPNVKIDAFLQENGDVHVQEKHTYQFDSKFNGITREIFPKKDAEITNFSANEGEKTLKVEKEDHLYKIHRKGKNETIEIVLDYRIENGMEKYEDMTEFYWPFFDQRNEADYGNMQIMIHPPKATDDVIAFGYDQAFNKQAIGKEGIVEFALGMVPAGENGDIRVAYPSTLFPAMSSTSSGYIKNELIQAKLDLEKKAQVFAENKAKFSSLSKTLIPFFLLLFMVLLGWEHISKKRKYSLVNAELKRDHTLIPDEKMSMPATIYYTLGVEAIHVPAGLLDLVRKGIVEQRSEDEFRRIHSQVQYKHEGILLKWLFDEVGHDGYFKAEDLDTFIKKEKNLTNYHTRLTEWKQAIKDEMKEAGVRERKTGFRMTFGFISLLLLGMGIASIYYEGIPMFLTSLGLLIVAAGIACFYRPLSSKGLYIKEEWTRFLKNLNQIKSTDWQKTSEDARMRMAVLGANAKFAKTKEPQQWQKEIESIDPSFMMYTLFSVPILYGGFDQADKKYSTYSQSSTEGTTGGSAGGIGGGGGGSGAF
ncbi:DUF2207 domain-containing protein [Lederbergia sp. NSJ-179]|uniref:DUF2207 domain-containing protein n=1 Tax=Lederbergia sp. NSJ-179 TaxID=2931402 RepID=UPI001FD09F61|nr:DUF2207 domain-containing protein [Lederbergia sp. NSJ-179]MCJ7842939.1 DUF2207 domain-containing protein [Lederbergia sp. NSJ-179]